MRRYEKLFCVLATVAVLLIDFFCLKNLADLETKVTLFAEQIEIPCSPIIETKEPAPTALSDEEDYECDQLFYL